MGDVWRGVDDVLARTVAVKILLPSLVAEPGFAARFRDEARTMATINHPGVVNVYDYGADAGVTYLVMEYVEGDALSKTLSQVGRLTPQRTMSLIAQAADALQAAHDKGIVHRDVKPANLLVRPNGTLVLTDFGIARREAAASNLTAVGSVLGTASYISPEQASGHGASPAVRRVRARRRRLPVPGRPPAVRGRQPDRDRRSSTSRRLRRRCRRTSRRPVRALVERCLAKAPAARFPSAAALASAARAAGGGSGLATQPIRHAPPTQPISPGPTAAADPSDVTYADHGAAGGHAAAAVPAISSGPQPRPSAAAGAQPRGGDRARHRCLGLLVMVASRR